MQKTDHDYLAAEKIQKKKIAIQNLLLIAYARLRYSKTINFACI